MAKVKTGRKGGMHTQNGSFVAVEKFMEKTPTKLFTATELAKALKIDHKKASEALGYLYRKGERVKRHIDKKDGQFQFAISIPEGKRNVYIKRGGSSPIRSDIDKINRLCDVLIDTALQLKEVANTSFSQLKDELAKAEKVRNVARQLEALNIGNEDR